MRDPWRVPGQDTGVNLKKEMSQVFKTSGLATNGHRRAEWQPQTCGVQNHPANLSEKHENDCPRFQDISGRAQPLKQAPGIGK